MDKNGEDHLMNFINDSEKSNQQNKNENIETFGQSYRKGVNHIESRADSDWVNIPLKDLPFGRYYQAGTTIFIRPAKTKEIESFALVNEQSYLDVILKMNEILSACTKVNLPDGTIGTSRDILDGDRVTIVVLIAKASAKNGRKIEKTATCHCKEEVKIELIPANYVYKDKDEELEPFYNVDTNKFVFELNNGAVVKLAMPTIGLTSDLVTYLTTESIKAQTSGGNFEINLQAQKLLPYIKAGEGYTSMTHEQIQQAEFEFSKMNDEVFMVINEVEEKMSFGIEKLKCTCPKCSREVYTNFSYPNGVRALFIIPNSIKQLVRQPV